MGDKKYRIKTDSGMVDGKKFSINGEEFKVDFPRRSFLKTCGVVGAGSVGVGSYLQQTQPALAVDGDWSASDVEAGDSIDAVLIGNGDLELSWNDLPNEEYYIDWTLEARLTEEGIENGSDEFEVVVQGDTDNAYTIFESDTPDGNENYIDFFRMYTSISSSNFTADTDEHDEYGNTDMISLSNEHSAIDINDFQLPEGESMTSTEVELQLTVELYSDEIGDDAVTSAVVLDSFEVIIESSDSAGATVGGTAGTDYD